MPCGDYVPEGKGDDGQDRVKEHLDSCPRRARGSKSPSGDDTDRSSTGTPELDASAKGRLDDSSRSPPDSKSSSSDDSDRSSAGTPKTSARVGSDETFTQPAISIRGMKVTARRAVFQNLVVSQTNNHTV
ncbi:uncharacterized protein LY79DRAFT_668117 [Colletotrichum navitas]|uniref:Uncharacterized protein n=1 Tax=Colletotrichum navitas TaxID=681940 RepID=A0AAD8Q530_9PEZI|nr:uncharacterized protein LY79DRAFT_668117 [Colletotrichum navitas]KAK1595332.1 hypothetical protein LY79DRAFT_668117 [Colletotrichum navitas]